MTVFKTADVMQHYFWRYMDQTHVARDEYFASKYRNAIYDTYERVDAAIGEILKQANKDTTAVVMSDHGFGPYTESWFFPPILTMT